MERHGCLGASAGRPQDPQQEFLRSTRQNILFICGGAFSGLEKIISARGRSTSIGFAAQVLAPEDRRTGEIFRHVEPEDLLKYGLIPEFVGRLPVVANLEDLDEASLKKILTDPKNALVKQYQRLVENGEYRAPPFATSAWRGSPRRADPSARPARGDCVRPRKNPARDHVQTIAGREGVRRGRDPRQAEVVEGTRPRPTLHPTPNRRPRRRAQPPALIRPGSGSIRISQTRRLPDFRPAEVAVGIALHLAPFGGRFS